LWLLILPFRLSGGALTMRSLLAGHSYYYPGTRQGRGLKRKIHSSSENVHVFRRILQESGQNDQER
jgi:hypothetical protein